MEFQAKQLLQAANLKLKWCVWAKPIFDNIEAVLFHPSAEVPLWSDFVRRVACTTYATEGTVYSKHVPLIQTGWNSNLFDHTKGVRQDNR